MNEDIINLFLTEETKTIANKLEWGCFRDDDLANAFCDIIERIDDKSFLVGMVSKLMEVSWQSGFDRALEKEESDDEDYYDED